MNTVTTISISLFLLAGDACAADDAEQQMDSLFGVYSSMCVKHVNDIVTLRNALKDRPRLPPDIAFTYLNGVPGSAWKIPDKFASVVLSLHESKAFCTVYGQQASAEVVEKRFADLVGKAPSQLRSVRVRDERVDTKERGPVHVISYAWSTQSGQQKLLFTLLTAPKAQLQAIMNVLALK